MQLSLSEKYRPKSLEQVIGQPEAVATLRGMIDRGVLGGHAYWLSGASGSGKTTLARIIAGEVADPFCVSEWDGSELSPSVLTDVASTWHQRGWGRGGRAFIVNEAHGLTKPTVRRLLTLFEKDDGIPEGMVWVFTTTTAGQQKFEDGIDADPFLSRCTVLPLAAWEPDVLAEYVRSIARAEGLDGQPLTSYVWLAQRLKWNPRAMLSAVEAGKMLVGTQR